jgi:hypothetical protein
MIAYNLRLRIIWCRLLSMEEVTYARIRSH